MHGPDGKHVSKMTMEEYANWQGWDEWPDRVDNPPLTVETTFWYRETEYMVTKLNKEYVIVKQPSFEEIVRNKNFLELLKMPFADGKSFQDLIGEFLFED